MASKKRPFLKSADTRASVNSSRAEVERMLTRYGATGFAYQRDYEQHRIVVQFVVPDTPTKDAGRVPVTLPVSIRDVYDRLYGRPTRSQRQPDGKWVQVWNSAGYDTKKLEQAERVAWRNLVLWIDAALSAAAIGLQSMSEAFFAHVTVALEDGRSERLSDHIRRTGGALPGGARALLPAPTPGARDAGAEATGNG